MASLAKKLLFQPVIAVNVNLGASLLKEVRLLAKWSFPAIVFAGWMVWPALKISGPPAAKDPSTIKFDKEEIGAIPRIKGYEAPETESTEINFEKDEIGAMPRRT